VARDAAPGTAHAVTREGTFGIAAVIHTLLMVKADQGSG
jgi:hypothetical protein